ncbi:hypothetical protein JNM87_00760 [Candidatus Saccharibacteria bacterium]|nr:hypothetical protein [Candidatus Saccharibacteria bacterium]
MKSKQTLDAKIIKKQLRIIMHAVNRYRSIIIFVVITSLYGYIVWRINVLSNAPPSQSDISNAQQSVPRPKISDSTVRKLQSLEDNSVRVQTLFNEARQNPFQE